MCHQAFGEFWMLINKAPLSIEMETGEAVEILLMPSR